MPLHGLSDRFLATVATNQRWRTKVEVRTAFNGYLLADISDYITAGSVTVDETAEIRRTLTLTLDGNPLLVPPQNLVGADPTSLGDMLHPAVGNELWVYRGVQYSDDPDDTEFAQLGVFRISRPQIVDNGATITMTINGNSRASVLARQDWQQPYTIGPGGGIFGVVEQVMNYLLCGGPAPPVTTANPKQLPLRPAIYEQLNFTFEIDPVDAPYPFVVNFNYPVTTFGADPSSAGDPMQDLITFVAAAGAEVFFDNKGDVIVRPIRNPTTELVADSLHFIEGQNCVMDSLTRTLDETTAYNGVILYCNGTGIALPFVVQVWDADPTSPTFYKGPWGQVPYKMTTTLIPAGSDSIDVAYLKGVHMAQQQLQLLLGSFDEVSLTCVPNPALQEGDICSITRERMQIVDVNYVISSMTIPLDPSTDMSISFRPRIQVSGYA